MPFHYEIEPERGRVTVVGQGRVDYPTGLQLAADIPNDRAFRSEFDVLADLREIEIDFETAEAEEAGARLGVLGARYRGRIALVTQPGFLFRLASYTALHAEEAGFPMKIFSSLEEAEEWIRGGGEPG